MGFHLGGRRRWCGEDPKRDPAPLVAYREPPIEVAADGDARLGITDALGIGQELEVLLVRSKAKQQTSSRLRSEGRGR